MTVKGGELDCHKIAMTRLTGLTIASDGLCELDVQIKFRWTALVSLRRVEFSGPIKFRGSLNDLTSLSSLRQISLKGLCKPNRDTFQQVLLLIYRLGRDRPDVQLL